MDKLLEAIAAELYSDKASITTLYMAMHYSTLCEHFGIAAPDWLRALANGNPKNITDLIAFCRAEKAKSA